MRNRNTTRTSKRSRRQPDFVFCLNADHVFAAGAEDRLPELYEYCEKNELDGLNCRKLNLWRSHSWRRVDNAYDDGWFTHLWRVTPSVGYEKVEKGLHQPGWLTILRKVEYNRDVEVLPPLGG